MTMQFDVTIQRTEYREHVFRVDVADSDAAFHAGLAAALDYDFHDSPVRSSSEDVTAIVHVETNREVRGRRPRKEKRETAMKVEYLIAWEDGTWTTQIHEVRTKSGHSLPRDTDILVKWAHDNLAGQAQFRRAVLFAVYGFPAND
jgi:hypothetical protein